MTRKPTTLLITSFIMLGLTAALPSFGATISSSAITDFNNNPRCSTQINDSSSSVAPSSCDLTSGQSFVLGQANASISSGVLSVNLLGHISPGDGTGQAAGSASINGLVLVSNAPNATYINVTPNTTGAINLSCQPTTPNAGGACTFVGGFGQSIGYAQAVGLPLLHSERVSYLDFDDFFYTPGTTTETPTVLVPSLKVPLFYNQAVISESMEADTFAYPWGDEATASFTGEFIDPLTITVLDQNGNVIPGATIQADFGLANNAMSTTPEPGAFALLGIGCLMLLFMAKRDSVRRTRSNLGK